MVNDVTTNDRFSHKRAFYLGLFNRLVALLTMALLVFVRN